MARRRNWCFTLNNYTEEDERLLTSLTEEDKVAYLIYGREKGASGTPHLQGYVEFFDNMRMGPVKVLLGGKVHLEPRRGKATQAAGYCRKEDEHPYEFGVISTERQGSRADLDEVRSTAAESGMGAVVRWGNLQQIRVAEKFLTYAEEPRDWPCQVTWIWGTTGTGKSRLARELAETRPFVKNCGSKWWQGYDAHEDVILDDFRPSWWSLTEMLSLLDRYEKIVECKGSTRQFKPRRIFVTSSIPPAECYREVEDTAKEQLLRRVDETLHMTPEKFRERWGEDGPSPPSAQKDLSDEPFSPVSMPLIPVNVELPVIEFDPSVVDLSQDSD